MDWFTSDPHFSHQNIIRYCDRPWATTDEMNVGLITNYNECVAKTDTLWFLGDMFFSCTKEQRLDILSQIKCKDKRLILGNHDGALAKCDETKAMFTSVEHYGEIARKIDGRKYHIVMMHYPILNWNRGHHGSIMLHGHTHGTCQYPWDHVRRIKDVGVDCCNYKPVSLETIIDEMKLISINNINHGSDSI